MHSIMGTARNWFVIDKFGHKGISRGALIILLPLLFFFPTTARGTALEPVSVSLSEYSALRFSQRTFSPDFPQFFADPKDATFSNLREYLWEKQEIEYLIKTAIYELSRKPKTMRDPVQDLLSSLQRQIVLQERRSRRNTADSLTISIFLQHPQFSRQGRFSIEELRVQIIPHLEERLQEALRQDKARAVALDTLTQNLKNTQQDITTCEHRIARLLSTDAMEQQFRTGISIAFTALIGLLLGGFFLILFIRSDVRLPELLLGPTGLQFLSLFVLIIAIILFGILNILEGRELAAILSGISGYILGKNTAPSEPSPTPSFTQETAPSAQI